MTHPKLQPRFPADQYLNRELGLLAFNRRVLAQAQDERVPLLERLRFLCIVFKQYGRVFRDRHGRAQVTTQGQRSRHYNRWPHGTGSFPAGFSRSPCHRDRSVPASQFGYSSRHWPNRASTSCAAPNGMKHSASGSAATSSAKWCRYSRPLGWTHRTPFPKVLNKSLNFAVELEGKDAFGRSSNAAIVQAPRVLPRVIRLPEELAGVEYGFVFLSSILHEFVGELFTGMTVLGCYQFRATRNSDLFVDEEEVTNLRTQVAGRIAAPSLRRCRASRNCPTTVRKR